MVTTNLSKTVYTKSATSQLSRTGRPKFVIVSDAERFYRAYNNVTLHLDGKIHTALKHLAEAQGVTISSMASEAVIAWVTWMYKERMEKEKAEDREASKEELENAQKLLDRIVLKRKIRKRERMMKMKLIEAETNPGGVHRIETRGRPRKKVEENNDWLE